MAEGVPGCLAEWRPILGSEATEVPETPIGRGVADGIAQAGSLDEFAPYRVERGGTQAGGGRHLVALAEGGADSPL
jgi:hypothetical protein